MQPKCSFFIMFNTTVLNILSFRCCSWYSLYSESETCYLLAVALKSHYVCAIVCVVGQYVPLFSPGLHYKVSAADLSCFFLVW